MRGNPTLRFIDRYVGIPIVAALGLTPKRRFDRERARRVGLMKTVAIGDIVMLGGIVADVRRAFPDATIVLITGEDNRAVGQMLIGPNDEHLVISPHRPLAAASAVRRARLDVLVDFGVWVRFDAVVSALSGAGFRAGFRTAGQGRHLAYDETVEHSGTIHEIDNNRRLANLIGVDSTSLPCIAPRGVLRPNELPRRPYVVFHAWPSGLMPEVKEWASDKWVELARRLRRDGRTFVLTGGPGDRAKTDRLASALRAADIEVLDAAGTFTLPQLTDVLAASEAVVSVNTGVMHLSAAVGARTVGLQGPTSSTRWAPLGPNSRAVDSTLPGCGYLNLGWEYAGHRLDCMDGVAVHAVSDAVESLLAASR